ncbi:hypothetical protein LZF95_21305 [Algoriphagus sp. AGSA1]|uniref:hypothetical protein n=1 Tax=Algoriphagus sp. AGSA1 TaxID=2907213 RepID=UPI001F17F647|nr:hypothetical protein [Algoriphagus sp. AGSA1]MCE7057233.1 hypothetical protein [Algoriphagus sp. AGSA1]
MKSKIPRAKRFGNNQLTSSSLAHLEQSHAPSPKGEGWGEVGRTANFYSTHPGINPETHLILNPIVK